jgi:hypothetical protein
MKVFACPSCMFVEEHHGSSAIGPRQLTLLATFENAECDILGNMPELLLYA